ncbi:hypothetical protein JIN85_00325 [Luteolibacter pohnpeiensis]|uniref:Uncharacterized protein n=1 Tax=Luteolibacter pohnpeiensis TaxID=454153 RepID=A0A934VUT2_9BACT|nr:hypothetical protein [Luteolibacter pohnpeiensis]MBK1880834.1 hypothetical protein [Luteolibacter pohnpeiensis]
MFCSWKSERGGGCNCAYRLRRPIGEILNHLCSIGPSTLILRSPGLTVAKATRFGLHIREKAGDWNVLHDAVSGLRTNLEVQQHAFIIREFSDQCPILAFAVDGRPADLSVRLVGHDWGSPAVRKMIADFDGVALDCAQSRQLGAGAWLDEWEQPKAKAPTVENRLDEACEILHSCQLLAVEVKTPTMQCDACFSPSFIDHEGTVIRIADRKRNHIVYADVDAAGFRLDHIGSQTAQLFHSI